MLPIGEFSSSSFYFDEFASETILSEESGEALRESLQRWDKACSSPFHGSPWMLAHELSGVSPYFRDLVDCSITRSFLQIALEIEQSLMTGLTPWGQRPSSSYGRWWRVATPNVAPLHLSRSSLAALGDNEVIRTAVADLDQLISRLDRLISKSSADTHYNLAGYSAYCADAYYRRGDYPAAILSLHRTLDFALQGQLIEANLVRESRDRFRFVDPQDGDRVSLITSFEALARASVTSPTYEMDQRVRWCNDVRNDLLLTHGIFGSSQAHTQRFRDNVYAALSTMFPMALARLRVIRGQMAWSLNLHPGILFI